MDRVKIIVVGDVRGKFKQLFQRVETINKKSGPFEICLCAGDFFGPDNDELIAYKNGNKHVPVPTFFLGPNSENLVEHYQNIENGEICENLTYLGKRGIYTLSSGVKIVYLSGVETTDETSSEHCFNKADVLALRNSCLASKSNLTDYKGVDVLLTSQWPYGMDKENKKASKLISFLSKEIKPRYHFCRSGPSGKYFEALPHRIPADNITQLELCTRFIAFAAVGNEAKEKYVFAVSLTPVDKMRVLDLIQKTTNEVLCPYVEISPMENLQQSKNADGTQYFYDMSGQDGRKRGLNNKQQHNKRPKIMNIDEEKCWFCLSSPDVEKHLVISIGDMFYLALAKGPINDWHVLIISITHIRCAAQLDENDWEELTKIKQALRDFFKSLGLVVCFTERNYKSSHLVINALGIEEGYAWKIKHSFEDKAEEFNFSLDHLSDLKSPQILPPQGPYFVAELPDNTALITRQMKHFPLHFARDVFCSENLLNCEEKVDWKDCKLEKDEEIALVKQFREKFAPFDFSL